MLAYDIARCKGEGSEEEGWREGCDDCLRRTEAGSEHWQAYMQPPAIVVFECEYRIATVETKGEEVKI